jgi:hypothetical protein
MFYTSFWTLAFLTKMQIFSLKSFISFSFFLSSCVFWSPVDSKFVPLSTALSTATFAYCRQQAKILVPESRNCLGKCTLSAIKSLVSHPPFHSYHFSIFSLTLETLLLSKSSQNLSKSSRGLHFFWVNLCLVRSSSHFLCLFGLFLINSC